MPARFDSFSLRAPGAVLAMMLSLPAAAAQSGGFSTPGMPGQSLEATQATRFSNQFNPAIGVVFDLLGDWTDVSGSSDQEGFDANLRVAEMTFSSWVDPSLWAYGVVVYADDEVSLEEGAMQYVGFGDSTWTLRGGRFFVDFGKQMQAHVHDLRTLERPAVLRAYLGEELGGDGVQLDKWFAAGDETVVRYSLGVFGSLIGEGPDVDGAAAPFDGERKDLNELALTARLTGFRDVGQSGTLQAGASARYLPDFGLEAPDSSAAGGSVDGLSNAVLGLDLTYGWQDETATRSWTAGGEALLYTGDLGGAVDDNLLPGDPSDDLVRVFDEDVFGYYVFADYAWNLRGSAGVQWSWVELPQDGAPELSEIELYYTRRLSEFQRLRFVASATDVDGPGDTTRLAVQWTGFLGPHSHGLNW